jgi:hypothetical protein
MFKIGSNLIEGLERSLGSPTCEIRKALFISDFVATWIGGRKFGESTRGKVWKTSGSLVSREFDLGSNLRLISGVDPIKSPTDRHHEGNDQQGE